MTLLTALLLGLTPIGAPGAYPIPPRPLRLLIAEADLIVTAQVREADARECAAAASIDAAVFDVRYVALDIEQLLKGALAVRTIVLPHDVGLICPAPARYEVGTRVLAFLDRTERGGFVTHALSYGAKTLDEAGLIAYRERIEEQLEIERMQEGPERLAAQVEWLVACAEHPATRWEGAYEFSTDAEARIRRDSSDPARFSRALSGAQRERLRRAYLSADSFDGGTQCLERFFRHDDDLRFLAWQVQRLRAVHQEAEQSAYGEAASLVACIARRDGRLGVRELAEAFDSMRPHGKRGDDAAGRLRIVRELLALYP